MIDLKPCKCGNKDLIHIKDFSDYHMIKCEECVCDMDSSCVHLLAGGKDYEAATEAWNKRV